MSRLIDADALIKHLDDAIRDAIRKDEICDYWEDDRSNLLYYLDNAPTIDAVEVVRCRECKHRPIKEDPNGENYGFNLIEPNDGDERCPCLVSDGWYSWMPNDNFYCGYGEREGE